MSLIFARFALAATVPEDRRYHPQTPGPHRGWRVERGWIGRRMPVSNGEQVLETGRPSHSHQGVRIGKREPAGFPAAWGHAMVTAQRQHIKSAITSRQCDSFVRWPIRNRHCVPQDVAVREASDDR
jgi:hypothetical protein